MAWTTTQRNNVMHILITEGNFTPTGAAGLVSRWANLENKSGNPGILGGYKGRAYGHGQWLGVRKPNLFSFAQERGLPVADDRTQALFALEEMTPGSKYADAQAVQAGKIFRTTSDPYQASRAASMFERAEGYNARTGTDNYTQRIAKGVPSIEEDYLTSESRLPDPRTYDEQRGSTLDFADVEKDAETGEFGEAGEKIGKTGDDEAPDTERAPEGMDLVDAINKQSQQLKENTEALVATDQQTTSAITEAAGGATTTFASLFSNLFVRGALIGLGAVLILAGVFGLAFGQKNIVSESVKRVAKRSVL